MHYLVVNPVAGRGRARALAGQVEAFFARCGQPVTTLQSARPRHATELVAGLPHDASVIALGGDGTLHEVAAACVGTGRTVGILPAGSGDDFAFALGLPRGNLDAALGAVERGAVRTVDTGVVNGEVFVNAFGVGFDADVAQAVLRAPRLLKETSAYLYAIVATLSRLRCEPVRLSVDGQLVFQGRALLVSTQNGPRTGGSFLFAPEARPDDGRFDVVVAGTFGRLGTLRILPQVMRGEHLGHPNIRLYHGRRVHITWRAPRPGHLEGELLAPSCEFHCELRPRSLRVYAP